MCCLPKPPPRNARCFGNNQDRPSGLDEISGEAKALLDDWVDHRHFEAGRLDEKLWEFFFKYVCRMLFVFV